MSLKIESIPANKGATSSDVIRDTSTGEYSGERHSPPVLVLDEKGYIQECSRAVEKLFGYRRHELIWQHISCLFPKLAEITLMQSGRLNPMLNYICHCDHSFEAINKQGDINICNLNFLLMEYGSTPNMRLIVRPLSSGKA